MTTPKQLAEITITLRAKVTDTSLPAADTNTSFDEYEIMVNGVELPNWVEQNTVSSIGTTMPHWVPVSSAFHTQTVLQLKDIALSILRYQGIIP